MAPGMGEIGKVGDLDLRKYCISICSRDLDPDKSHNWFVQKFSIRGQECQDR
jgi:hypothetical protein